MRLAKFGERIRSAFRTLNGRKNEYGKYINEGCRLSLVVYISVLILLQVYIDIISIISDLSSISSCSTKPLDLQCITPNLSISGMKSPMEVKSHQQRPPKSFVQANSNPISIINHQESQKRFHSTTNFRASSKLQELKHELAPSSFPTSIEMPCRISKPQELPVSKSSSNNFLSSFLSTLRLGTANSTSCDTDKKVFWCPI